MAELMKINYNLIWYYIRYDCGSFMRDIRRLDMQALDSIQKELGRVKAENRQLQQDNIELRYENNCLKNENTRLRASQHSTMGVWD